MTANTAPVPCDCLVYCGDDPWLKTGQSEPCASLQERHKQAAIAAERQKTIDALCKFYSVTNILDLVDAQHAQIEKLQARLSSVRPSMAVHQIVRKA